METSTDQILHDKVYEATRAIRDAHFQNTPQITLGELIKQIEGMGVNTDPDGPFEGKPKYVKFDFGTAIPTKLDSWRGAYDEIALGYKLTGYDDDSSHMDEITAEDLLKELKAAIGKTYTGWKGGDFVMSESTPIWVANPGNSGETGIIAAYDDSFRIILMTSFCEY